MSYYASFIPILVVVIILLALVKKKLAFILMAKKLFFKGNEEIMSILETLCSEQAKVAINCFDSYETVKGIIISVDDNFVTVQTEKKGIKNEITLNKMFIKTIKKI